MLFPEVSRSLSDTAFSPKRAGADSHGIITEAVIHSVGMVCRRRRALKMGGLGEPTLLGHTLVSLLGGQEYPL